MKDAAIKNDISEHNSCFPYMLSFSPDHNCQTYRILHYLLCIAIEFLNGIESRKVTFHVAIHPSISPERCSIPVFSINYKRQVDFIVILFVSVKKIFMKPGPVNS
ncbi:hypothetical protein T08_5410 [Trichinella sp. T8]|nr:hypothetical protein T08_5410 [Trichinella sp. T8]